MTVYSKFSTPVEIFAHIFQRMTKCLADQFRKSASLLLFAMRFNDLSRFNDRQRLLINRSAKAFTANATFSRICLCWNAKEYT